MPQQAKIYPTHEQIQQRAYEIYLERGGQGGDDVTDWIRAEQELTASPASPVNGHELLRTDANEAAKSARRRIAN